MLILGRPARHASVVQHLDVTVVHHPDITVVHHLDVTVAHHLDVTVVLRQGRHRRSRSERVFHRHSQDDRG